MRWGQNSFAVAEGEEGGGFSAGMFRLVPRPLAFHALAWLIQGLNAKERMVESSALKAELKKMMVADLMLQVSAEEIGDDQALFGPGSLGLDSVDALQLVVALDKNYGLKVPDPEAAKTILHSVNSMAEAVAQKQQNS